MNDSDICTCHHTRRWHSRGACDLHEIGACPCSRFVLAGGSTTPGPSVTEHERREAAAAVLDQMLADALDVYEEGVTEAQIAAARIGQVAREGIAAARRAAVLHPIAQAAAAEQVDVGDGTEILPFICYCCGHTRGAHGQHGCFGVEACPCPVYVETPPVDACGRCGHAQNLHKPAVISGIPGVRCFGTGVDDDGNERARSCQCGAFGGYLPEQPPEIEPVDRLCLCGHLESQHGTMPWADQLRDAPDRPHACLAYNVEGGYADSCIEFRPATITEVLPNGVVLEHTPYADRDPR